jgi:hypothetical protein
MLPNPVLCGRALLLFTLLAEPRKPLSNDPELLGADPVDATSTLLLVRDQLCVLEDSEVTCRGRPRMLKAFGDISSTHGSTPEAKGHEDLPPGPVSQCREDGVQLVQALLWARAFQGSRTAGAGTPCPR